VVPGQHRAREIIETARIRLAPVTLAMRLRVVAPVPITDELLQAGQRTPSGQRCWRTRAKHLASSIMPIALSFDFVVTSGVG